ncbi:hypothetical protein QFC22_005791 [Naganishia vaughanmartiniae]|uniref:Uncharacterized protein n=1 Tax=Naganishia vaughanmartiniae TaxID=1424756 RepID=A0ACC2WS18_9TREE|nr:hypothetical protein QFC22_005791 [Naganishia vaughanmartiniae]
MDTSIFTVVVRLASLAKEPVSLQDLDLNAQEEYKKPTRDFLADIINKEMEKTMRDDLVKMFSDGQISPASLLRIGSCAKLVNQRLVNATQDRNDKPVVGLDDHGNLVTQYGSSFIHAVAFDENPKLASAYKEMNRTGGFPDLDRLERDSPMDTNGLKKLFEPALYRLAYMSTPPGAAGETKCLMQFFRRQVNKNNYVGESAVPGTRKEQHRTQCANKEGVNTAVADLNMKEIPYPFEIFHRFRLGATLFEQLALVSSIIACAGTSLATISGRERHRRLQFKPISPILANQLDCPFSLRTIRTSYIHYLVMAYSEREANRSNLPLRERRPHDKVLDRYIQAWKIILGRDIVPWIEEEGWTVQKYLAVVLFHGHARPLRDQLDKFYGAPNRLWTTERMYPSAGKIKGRSKEVQRAERVARV